MHHSPERLMRAGFAIVIAILLFITGISFQKMAQLQESNGWTSHTQEGRIELVRTLLCLLALIALGLVCFGVRHILRARQQAHHEAAVADASLQEEARRLAAIIATQQEIVRARSDLDAVLVVAVARSQQITCADGGVIEMLEGEEMVYRAVSGAAAAYRGIRLQVARSLSGQCIRNNQVLQCDDTETDARVDREACRRIGIRSMIVVPLYHNQEAIGVLKVFSMRALAFTEGDRIVLQLMAGVIATAMSQATMLEAKQALFDEQENTVRTLQQSREQLHAMNDQLERHILLTHEQAVTLEMQKAALEEANARLEALATLDGLTGIKNHRAFQERAAVEFERSERYRTSLSLLMIDVDLFKSFNDTFGHPAGDRVLRQVAQALKAVARTTDFVARYGGEEFVFLLPETGMEGAMEMAERIRAAIAGQEWEYRDVTLSIGVSTSQARNHTLPLLLQEADHALYRSKAQGRNRATHYIDMKSVRSLADNPQDPDEVLRERDFPRLRAAKDPNPTSIRKHPMTQGGSVACDGGIT